MKLRRRLLSCLVLSLSIVSLIAQPALAANQNPGWQRGVSITGRTTTDLASPEGLATLDQLKATGANYTTFTVPYYQPGFGASNGFHPGANTPTDETLSAAIAAAKVRGLRVMLKIHMENDQGGWRAGINPGNRDEWFKNYGDLLVHYGQLAQTSGNVYTYCLGAELVKMTRPDVDKTNTSHWVEMIARVRQVYGGQLTYSAERPGSYDEIQKLGFWNKLDYIGLSGYFSINPSGSDTLAKMKATWADYDSKYLKPISKKYKKKIVFTEIGYRSYDNSYHKPSSWSNTDVVESQADQKLAYQAFFAYWTGKSHMHGVHWWDWAPDPTAGGSGNTDFTVQNKSAYALLVKQWGGPGQGPTAGPVVQVDSPKSGATLKGDVTLKASMVGRPDSSYRMYWRVDGDTLNLMPDNQASINVDGWSWSASKRYKLDFIAYDLNGVLLASKSVTITVN